MRDLVKFGTVSTAGMVAAVVFGFSLAAPPAAAEESLTVVSWGGAYSMSQRKAFYEPFTKEFGIKVLEDEWQGDLGQFRAQEETGVYKWDVIDVDYAAALVGCDEGILEEIDYKNVMGGRDRFLPGAALDCAVATISWSTIYAYDADVYPDDAKHPKILKDLFDLTKFPGRRGFGKSTSKIDLEFALMADGVAPDKVYEVLGTEEGLHRALGVFEKMKDNITWWESGAQSVQLLANKEVAMTTSWNGRIFNAVKNEGKNFRIVWDEQAMEYDLWAVIKGNPKKDLAMKFIEYTVRPEVMKNQSKYISYGPTTYAALKLIDPAIMADLPTSPANSKTVFVVDQKFWLEHLEQYNEIWNAWLAKL